MTSVRRAFAFATGEKYISAVLSIGTTAIVARLILPSEFGIAVLGMAALSVAQAMRELGSSAFIVQHADLTTAKMRTVFTINLMITLVLAIVFLVGAPVLASLLRAPGLERYLPVAALAFVTGAVVFPLHASLARDLKFKSLAGINVASSVVNSGVLILCAASGLSFLSFAWANVASALVGSVLLMWVRPRFEIFRLDTSAWSEVLSFSIFTGGSALLQRLSELLTLSILNITLSPLGVGLLHRASMICQFPERTVLAGVSAIALPVFSNRGRQKVDLGRVYLAAIDRLTVVIWPALGLIFLYAPVLVRLLLGPNWDEVTPLVRIIAAALFLNFPPGINYPLIIATGATKKVFFASALQVATTLPIIAVAAQFGITAVAWSTFALVALGVAISTYIVRSVVAFSWRDIAVSLQRSLKASILALIGPGLLAMIAGPDQSVLVFLTSACLAVIGWVAGLYLTDHPMLAEVQRTVRAIRSKL
ncbi:oligosaccharide flippase family protein [Ruegeria sp. 2012CJ41-6]|uniref:Oligosaccharide flippase family protein n=1 Tax=Ruegeria spongiae TaxID=2942209 RepID=A0ABT0Q5P7_9RHOB|nr:oligosaccharide flippase family protein [Ruegeria spongiae]MCL6285135.1 oligosaccharide flippase family protein [Ruegeria spongiae]